MTVRWKPLVFLSGLFLIVGLVGVVAIVVTLTPHSSREVLRRARAAQEAGHFENAEIYYKQALQIDGKDAAVHYQIAGLYRDWVRRAPAEKQIALQTQRIEHLMNAVKFDKVILGPRQELLKIFMDEDLAGADLSIQWARDVLNVDAANTDAHFVLAMAALDERTPKIADARRHIEALGAKKAPAIRLLWAKARLAEATGDQPGLASVLAQARAITLGADAGPVDRLAGIQLAALAVRDETDPGRLDEQVNGMLTQVKALCQVAKLGPPCVSRLRLVLEQTQKALTQRSARLAAVSNNAIEKSAGPSSVDRNNAAAAAATRPVMDRLVSAIEQGLESMFQLALSSDRDPDLQIFVAYADHLRLRTERDRCLELVDRALKSPQATRRTSVLMVMNLHTVAVEMALSRADDAGRFDKAAPHIQALVECAEPRAQGLGHLFAGSVDLDRSGVAREMNAAENTPVSRENAGKFRLSALRHLKVAAAQLPEMAEAQARYGVALVLAGEQNLGRQFLQTALRLGGLDAQYQLWAAWAILQAGYPEEAEPIIASLTRQVGSANVPREMEAGIFLLSGEIHQARRTPEELNKAIADFERSLAASHGANATVIVRLA
jgi:tetratricopeptide (TPR) repeat protein